MSHAILSPSAASRWLACTPSARLEAKFPDTAGDFAKEGTLAHNFGEAILLNAVGELSNAQFRKRIKEFSLDKFYSVELQEYAEGYADFVKEKLALSRRSTPDAILKVEEKIDLTAYVPEGFGTGDAIILADGTLEIIDLKYGKGVRVSAVENRQMMLYALGALDMLGFMYAIDNVRMTIYQPRLDNISEWEMPAKDLIEWGESELKPRAKTAFDGAGDYIPGEHCRFCRAKAQCRALADANLEIAKYEFDNVGLLSDGEISDILLKIDRVKSWITSIEEYSLQSALKGKKFPGFKLVEGRSIRKYADEDKVAATLIANGFKKENIFNPAKLKTITDMEKLLTKKAFSSLLGDLVIKPQGKPTLVPESDNRPELNNVESDFKNININD